MPLTVHCFHHLPLKNRRFRAGGILVCRNFCDSLLSNLLKSTNRSLTNTGRRLNASASAPVCFLWTWPIHSAEVGAWWYGPGRVQKGDNIYRRHRQCLNAGWQDDFRLLKLGRRWIFQHKKDPQSSARITQEFLKKENVKKNKTQKTITWPSISPAFSQIKKPLGCFRKRKGEAAHPLHQRRAGGKKRVSEEWQNISSEICTIAASKIKVDIRSVEKKLLQIWAPFVGSDLKQFLLQ